MNADQRTGARWEKKHRRGDAFISWSAMVAVMIVLLAWLSLTVSAQQAPPPSSLTITVSSQGITPSSATVNAGVIRLTIENQKALDRVTLRLNDQSGQLIREISLPDKSTEWNTELNLGVGQYVISDVNNPSASCRITVQSPPAS